MIGYKNGGRCITQARKYLQQQPVLVDGFLFDMDADSERYMGRTLEFWDTAIYPTIIWTMADDTEVEVTKGQLSGLWARACKLQFNRGIALHYRSRELKKMIGSLKRSDISINSDHWDITRSLADILADQ